LEKDLLELKQKTNDPNIWENLEAKTLFQNIKIVEKKIADFQRIKQSLSDLKEFYAFAVDENDQQTIIQLVEDSYQLLKDSTEVRYLNLMNGEADQNNAFVEIHAETIIQLVEDSNQLLKDSTEVRYKIPISCLRILPKSGT